MQKVLFLAEVLILLRSRLLGHHAAPPSPPSKESPAHIQTTFLSKFEPIPVLFSENVSPQNFLVMIWPIILHVSSSLEPEDPKINTVALQVDEDFLEALWTFKIIHFNAYSKLVIEKIALEKLHILVNLPTSSANLSGIKLIRSSVFYGVSKELGQIVVVVPPLNSLTEDQIKKVRSVCLETEDLKTLKPQIFV